jgi:hypothetical protein
LFFETLINYFYDASEYNTMVSPSFWGRFTKSIAVNAFNIGDGGFAAGFTYIGYPGFNQKESTYYTILVRGVDPHSTRQPVTYGLGRLFLKKNHWDVTVTGNPGDRPVITFGGEDGVKYVVEVSTDNKTYTKVTTLTATDDNNSYTDTARDLGPTPLFYRVIAL